MGLFDLEGSVGMFLDFHLILNCEFLRLLSGGKRIRSEQGASYAL